MSPTTILVVASLVLWSGAHAEAPLDTTQVWSWNAGTDLRVYAGSFSRDVVSREIELTALRNERVHVQIGVRAAQDVIVCARLTRFEGPDGAPSGVRSEVRVPRLILVDENRQFTPDALIPLDSLALQANVSRSFWFTFSVPKNASAGIHRCVIEVEFVGARTDSYNVALKVLPVALPDPWDYSFHLNIWQDPASIARWHGVDLWSEEHWALIERYARDLADHGQKSATTTIIEGPWDAQTGHRFPSMVTWKYPGEWKLDKTDRFSFDFTVFDRYVETLEAAGVREAIHAYSIVYGPGRRNDCQITYIDTETGEKKVKNTLVGDPWYMAAWKTFLPVFVEHLRRKGWLEKTYLGMDEKPDEVLEIILPLVRETAPGLKVALAGYGGKYMSVVDDFAISYRHLFDPEGEYPLQPEVRRRQGKRTTFYVAVGPIRPNTFLFSPLFESRILPWISVAANLDGFLRWAYNMWPDGLWDQPFYRWHSGDMFLVYPGDRGPWDSVRWEMLHQGIQDVEALRLAKTLLAQARQRGLSADQLELLERDLDRAVHLATRQYLDGSSRYPVPQEARTLVNGVLEEVLTMLGAD